MLKRRIYSVPVILFVLLFVPVFCNVIIKGIEADDAVIYKIATLHTNKVLFMYALVAIGILFVIYILGRCIKDNCYSYSAAIIFSVAVAVMMYFVNVYIAKCIAFYGGWDCGMVAFSTRWLYEGGDIGYGEYYQVFSNNVPII